MKPRQPAPGPGSGGQVPNPAEDLASGRCGSRINRGERPCTRPPWPAPPAGTRTRSTRATRATAASARSSPRYDNDAIRASVTPRAHRGRPAHAVALRRLPARLAAAAAACPSACTPLLPAPRLAAALGLRELLRQGRGRQPDALVQGPRRRPSPRPAPCELGFTALACASTGNLAGAVAAQAAALGLEAYVFIPADLEREKIIAAVGAGRAGVRGRRQLRRRQPPLRRARLRPAVGVRQHERARRTTRRARRRWRTRRPSSSAGGCPAQTVAPIASGSLYTSCDRGYRDLLETRPRRRRRSARGVRRPGRGLLAGRRRPGPPASDEVRPVRPDTIAKSLAIGAPADGENALGVARRTGGAIAAVRRRRDRRGHRPARPHHRHLHGDGRRRHRRDARAPRPRGPARPRRHRPSCTSRATA